MKTISCIIAAALLPSIALAADLSGHWEIESSIGSTPIKVNCTLIQTGESLSGHCTPVMENPEPADLTGTTDGASAKWAYNVVFNGNPGHVAFEATSLSARTMSGTLSLSGNPTPFTATKLESASR